MIAVDTNVLVRFLVKDDEGQFEQSKRLFKNMPVFISHTVLLETEWVLRHAYGFRPGDIISAFRKLLGVTTIHMTKLTLVQLALDWHERGLDFADALHLAYGQHCDSFYTFDQTFVRRSENLGNCPMQVPT